MNFFATPPANNGDNSLFNANWQVITLLKEVANIDRLGNRALHRMLGNFAHALRRSYQDRETRLWSQIPFRNK
jgi:hypothetical protein